MLESLVVGFFLGVAIIVMVAISANRAQRAADKREQSGKSPNPTPPAGDDSET